MLSETLGFVYTTLVLGFIAKFKYVADQLLNVAGQFASPSRTVTCILVCMLCTNVPFLSSPMATMAQRRMEASDVIYLTKNVTMILVGFTQL